MNDERKALLDAAATLIAELRKITGPVNTVVNKLIEAADADKVSDADAQEEARGVVTRKLGVKKLAEKVKKPTVQSAVEALAEADGEQKKKPKRKMPPLTPEQKAQRVESLKKARAAKKGKAQ